MEENGMSYQKVNHPPQETWQFKKTNALIASYRT
jgi:hypothetical protein